MSETQFLVNKLIKDGRTKLVRLTESSLVPIEINLWKEVWIKEASDLKGRARSFYAEVRYRDDHLVMSECTIRDLLRKVGRVLLLLTDLGGETHGQN